MRVWAFCIVALAIAAAPAALACGDKYLVTSRGTRFERSGFVRSSAAVLVFAPNAGTLAPAMQSLGLHAALAKVGYTTAIVDSREQLDAAIRTGRWDAVLVELSDRHLVVTAPASAAAPAVVALAIGASGADVKQARRDVARVVRDPKRASPVVDALDQVLFERSVKGRNSRGA